MRFEGLSAIITGAASGVGRAASRRFAAEGAKVILVDRNEEGLAQVAKEIGANASFIAVDLMEPANCEAVVNHALQWSGRIDILCNSAGVLDMAPLQDLTPERWGRVIGVNLSAMFYLCRAAMPHLVEQRGSIVNVASVSGLVGQPFNAAYVASKHGVVGLTKALALEFAKAGVRVNAVCPTGVNTPMIAAPPAPGVDLELLTNSAGPWLDGGQLLEPEDIADAMAFLASSDAKRITGIAMPVDGGHSAN
jgi:meso-butanediol dehydrogenase / (S,S)-butanediol dehydrogenase / diacetyl reductase